MHRPQRRQQPPRKDDQVLSPTPNKVRTMHKPVGVIAYIARHQSREVTISTGPHQIMTDTQ